MTQFNRVSETDRFYGEQLPIRSLAWLGGLAIGIGAGFEAAALQAKNYTDLAQHYLFDASIPAGELIQKLNLLSQLDGTMTDYEQKATEAFLVGGLGLVAHVLFRLRSLNREQKKLLKPIIERR